MQISAITSSSNAYAQNETGMNNTSQDSIEQSPTPTQNQTAQTSSNESEDMFNITASQKVQIQPLFNQEVPDETLVIEKPELEEESGEASELTNQVTNKNIVGPEPGTATEILDFEMNGQNVSAFGFEDTATIATSIVKQMSLVQFENNIERISIGDFRIFKNSLVCPPSENSASCPYAFPVEPVVANNGRNVFFAGNVFAARSNDGGDTWQYINPQDHGRLFCCDQDIIYSPQYDIFIWYLQGGFASPAGSGPGYSTIAVSRDLNNWWYYNLPSTLFEQGGTSQWFDFPHIALSDNNFYLTTHMTRQEDYGFVGNLISRWDLRAMSNAQPVTILYIINPEAGISTVEGATNIMYFGTNNVCEPGLSGCVHSNHLLKVLRWDERSPNVESRVVDIIPWQPTISEAPDCPSPDSTVNFCSAIVRGGPNAVSGGWVLNGAVGFVWNSNQGSGFPHMYVNGAVLNANDLSYNHRLLLWDERGAFMQAHVAVSQGRLALAAYYGDSARHPTVGVALFANNDIRIPGFIMVMDGQASAALGDYLRVRPYSGTGFLQGSGPLWVGSGYTRMVSRGQAYDQPFYYIFGIEGPAGNPFIRNTAPICTAATPSQSVLWPPNHRMVDITIQNVIDRDGDPLTIRITSIRQDEPTRGQGMGDPSPDGAGIGTSTAQVRAERTENGDEGITTRRDGRVYHISFTANDGRGAECTGEVLVSVPHDQRGAPGIDSGARFDSTQ
jgi:hypothetical protein